MGKLMHKNAIKHKAGSRGCFRIKSHRKIFSRGGVVADANFSLGSAKANSKRKREKKNIAKNSKNIN